MPDYFDALKSALANRYELDREIGRGGMARVYLARDPRHVRPVAVKVLNPELTAAVGAQRFLQEIRIAAQLSHPHILPLFDSGEADGFLYYVMPVVEGESLRDRLRREQQLPIEDAIEITKAVAAGLEYAHDRGVVHRDIKPDNILFYADLPMIADFGIARAARAGDESDRITETGLLLGTPAYMSPEQASGDTRLDARSDIYSLGCVVYEMLAGQPPFVGANTRAVMARHVTDPIPPLTTVRPSVTDAIARAVNTALAKVPADRFSRPLEFVKALEARSPVVAPSSPLARLTQATRPPHSVHAHECYLRARRDIWRFTEPAIVHALQYLQEALSIVGQDVLLYAGIAEAYFVFPQVRGNEYDACLERVQDCMDRIVELDGDSPHGHCLTGLMQWRKSGFSVEPLQSLNRALELNPDDPFILFWNGLHAVQSGRIKAAEACVDRLLRLDPRSPRSHWNGGWYHLTRGNVLAAAQSFQAADKIDPGNPQLRFLCGYTRAAQGEREEAYSLFDSIIKDTPDTVCAWTAKLFKYALRGHKGRATKALTHELKQAARLNPIYSLHIAECLTVIGEYPQALEWLDNAIRRGFANLPFLREHSVFLTDLHDAPRFEGLLGQAESDWPQPAASS